MTTPLWDLRHDEFKKIVECCKCYTDKNLWIDMSSNGFNEVWCESCMKEYDESGELIVKYEEVEND